MEDTETFEVKGEKKKPKPTKKTPTNSFTQINSAIKVKTNIFKLQRQKTS